MGKVRSTFRTMTTSILKTRSDIPAQVSITEGVGNIDCVDISLNAVKNLIGATTFSIYDICRHDNVNVWSQFGPTLRSYTGTGVFNNAALVNTKPTEYKLGDFAGYDHVPVVEPGYGTNPNPTAIYVPSGSSATVVVNVNIGEFDYPNVGPNPGLLFVLFNGAGGIEGWDLTDLNDYGHNAVLSLDTINPITKNKTDWYAGVYITNDNTVVNPASLETTVLCRVPNCPVFQVDITVILASSAVYADTMSGEPSAPWVNNAGPLGMNWTSGYLTIGYDIQNPNNIANLYIYAEMRDYTGTLIHTEDIFNGNYTAFDSISGSWYMGMTNIGSFGYYVKVYIEESE